MIGPVRKRNTNELIEFILKSSDKTIILDADGLFYFTQKLDFLNA